MNQSKQLLKTIVAELEKANPELKAEIEKSAGLTYLIGGFPEEYLKLVGDSVGKIFDGRIMIQQYKNLQDFRLHLDEIANISDSSLEESVEFAVGKDIDLDGTLNKISSLGYSAQSKVWEPGEFSLLGDILSVWIKGWDHIIRISFFGYEVETISLVDSRLRRKEKELDNIRIPSVKQFKDNRIPVLWGHEDSLNEVKANLVYIRNLVEQDLEVLSFWNKEKSLDWSFRMVSVPFSSISGTQYNDISSNVLSKVMGSYNKKGFKLNLVASVEGLAKVKEMYLQDNFDRTPFCVWNEKDFNEHYFAKGFLLKKSRQLFITDFELFGEVDLARLGKQSRVIKDDLFTKIKIGDYVVHEDHGVGIYSGIELVKGKNYFLIKYKGKDKLFLPLEQSSKISRYVGSSPKLSKLQGGRWQRIKNSIKKETEKIAKELLQLYSLREGTDFGAMFQNDLQLERLSEFIDSFQYEDTEDQTITTNEIVEDLQDIHPMDRLLIGDVGFGKTEVAARVMFAFADSGYQVAFLAPTTILVEQHHAVLKERFKGFNIRIESVSRLKTKSETDEVLNKLEKGEVDIVIGTHSLLSDRVKFNNLGLIVIDEEQRFGVKHKEKLKVKRIDVNVLSMSATPIPRSLQMSLSGIRDISIISTPPPNRKSIINSFNKFSWESVFAAIKKEFQRKGQAYYLHNRIRDIDAIALKIQAAFPDKVIEVAHGRLPNKVLGKTMSQMASGKIDLLVSTTIIENGIDLPNVNTLIIDDIEHLGLAQMYQIRGRIGRGDRQGYAYFLYKSLKGNSKLRLQALEEFSDLGSGFLLANRDLEIRGAGNILGKEQSGVIERVGYHLYLKMLREEIRKLKKNLRKKKEVELKEMFRFK